MEEGSFIISVVGLDQQDQEELEEACRQLRDDLEQIDDVELSEVPGEPVAEGTRSPLIPTLGAALFVAIYGRKMALMAKEDVKRVMAQILRVIDQWQQRHKNTRVDFKLPDGTEAHVSGFDAESTQSMIETMVKSSESRNGG
jgi:hypothetical protein